MTEETVKIISDNARGYVLKKRSEIVQGDVKYSKPAAVKVGKPDDGPGVDDE